VFISGEWVVIHRATGRQIGGVCSSPTAAVLFAGALLALPAEWADARPTIDLAACEALQARIEARL
jgi:hypothetical protein